MNAARAVEGIDIQRRSAGSSSPETHTAAVALADPRPGLTWLDIGAGTGDMLREIGDRWRPTRLVAVDMLPWLDPDLRPVVGLHIGYALEALMHLQPVDRVLEWRRSSTSRRPGPRYALPLGW
jgi:hypothetical protein